ncbi:hypothetical protein E8L90_28205 [Brevibacillus antibioticus]|uniref:Uncharacterized protein n=1 Tax=Brevibacillus antibioticus TaxID=2570228 RepID=A0A4U2YDZ0_9BACL|nr:hypothetical protein [Brevibacillus antibioticus]TKI58960.1 hypothetical protein E8L90_28205 [Brevibacillus antibioticus]
MSGLEDEKLTVQLRGLRRQDPPPRQEFVTYLDQTLVKKARQMKNRQKVYHVLSVPGGVAAAVALALFVAMPVGKESQEGTSGIRSEERPVTVSLSEKMGVTPQEPVSKQQPVKREEGQTKQSREQAVEPKTQSFANKQAQQKEATSNSNGPALSIEKYMQQKLGDKSKQYRMVSSQQETNTAVFQREINGVPFVDSVVKVRLEEDGRPKGMVMEESIHAEAELSLFPSPAKAISKEEALQRLTVNLKPEEAATFSGYINALNGEVLDKHFQSLTAGSGYNLIPIQAQAKPLKASSKEEIASLIQHEFGVHIGGENRPVATLKGETFMEYRWKVADATYLTARFASPSGQLLTYRMKKRTDSETLPELSQAEAAQMGAKKLESYLPTSITQLAMDGAAVEGSAIRLDFTAIAQGVRLDSHPYKVWVDGTSKQVIGMEGDFTEGGKVLTEPIKGNGPRLELIYVWPERNGKRTSAPYLVYQVKQ